MLANIIPAEALNTFDCFDLASHPSGIHGEKGTLHIAIGLRMERHVGRLELNL